MVPEHRPWPRMLVWPLGLVAGVGLFLARLYPDLLLRWAHCPLRETTGVPCFTCGGTRSLVALVQGRLAESLTANPLLFFLFLIMGLWAGVALVTTFVPRWRFSLVLTRTEKKAARWMAAFTIVANWIYLILRF